jgi:hypothetical protein
MYYFSTYFDKNYLSRGLALWESLQRFLVSDFTLYVLALDSEVEVFFQKNHFKGIEIIKLVDLEEHDKELLAVKTQRKPVEYFFTISPCLPLYLLEKHEQIDMITQVDADIYFYQSPKVLFDELGDNSVLICSHNFSERNKHLEIWGKYNVVFNAFKRTNNGLACLKWWREQCIAWCHDYENNGRFADQKYMEQFPILFDEIIISKNKGANVAAFNIDNYTITQQHKRYKVDEELIVFYHFQHLHKLNKYLFEPNFHHLIDYKNKTLIRIYIYYIKRLCYYDKKYNLYTNQPLRHNDFYQNKEVIKKKLIYGYLIIVSNIYSGVIHLEKYFNLYMKVKLLFSPK